MALNRIVTDLGELAGELEQSKVVGLPADLAAKAPLASPAFTGTPTAPTATAGTNTTQLATTAFVAEGLALKADDSNTVHKTGAAQTVDAATTFSGNLVVGGTLTVGPEETIQFVDTGEGNAKLSGQNIFAFDTDEFWVRTADGTNMAKFIKAVEAIFFFYPLVLPEVADADIFNGGIAWSLTNPGVLKARKPDGTLRTLAFVEDL